MRNFNSLSIIVKLWIIFDPNHDPMNKSSSIEKRLAQYGGVAAAVLATAPLQGQIMYTDVNPDGIAFGNDTIAIDINQDGTPDFMAITLATSYPGYGNVQAAGIGFYSGGTSNSFSSQKVAGTITTTGTSSSYYTIDKFEVNAVVGASANFLSGGFLAGEISGMPIPQEQWNGVKDKYAGIAFLDPDNNQVHYGWVRMDVGTQGDTVIVKDYALNLTAGAPINAGQTGLSIIEDLKSKFSIAHSNGEIRITTQPSFGTHKVRIADLSGKLILELEGEAGSTLNIPTDGIAVAAYMLSMVREDIILSQKIMIQ